MIWIPQLLCSGALLWALNPENPYAYYILLRWMCCSTFGFLAFKSLELNKSGWLWIFASAALLYNPIARIHLNREIWSVVNLASVVILLSSVFVFKARRKDSNSSEDCRALTEP